MTSEEYFTALVPREMAGSRVDRVVAALFPDYSRTRLQRWINDGQVTLDGQICRPKDAVFGGECVALTAVMDREVVWRPQPLPLDVVYRDDAIMVVNKPAGLVVHPAPGNPDGTLVNGLLYSDPGLAELPRAGIVHRLDKDTTGLMVVARTLTAQKTLVELIQARSVKRRYQALVCGVMSGGGTIDAAVGRHPVDRKRMAVAANGRPAVSHYRVIERFRAHTHVRVDLETGRTHQIRVHMAHIRYPLVGDPVYGRRLIYPSDCNDALKMALSRFKRQALHAARLGLEHPVSGQWLQWEASQPGDMAALIELLRDNTPAHE